jgi:hypothetical protein
MAKKVSYRGLPFDLTYEATAAGKRVKADTITAPARITGMTTTTPSKSIATDTRRRPKVISPIFRLR